MGYCTLKGNCTEIPFICVFASILESRNSDEFPHFYLFSTLAEPLSFYSIFSFLCGQMSLIRIAYSGKDKSDLQENKSSLVFTTNCLLILREGSALPSVTSSMVKRWQAQSWTGIVLMATTAMNS